MSALLNKVSRLVQTNPVLLQSKRFRGKINIQRPRAPHYEKARVLKLTEPYFPSKVKNVPFIELCGNLKSKVADSEIENKYENILAKECLNWFNHSRLIALCHLNPMSSEEKFKAYVAFTKSNIHMKIYGLKTLKKAVDGTVYEAFTENYVSHNIILFSPEPNIKELLKINKKFPQMILLAGIFEGKYLSKEELIKYSQIADIQVARASLVQTLQSAGVHLTQKLTQQQDTLVARLQGRADQLKDK